MICDRLGLLSSTSLLPHRRPSLPASLSAARGQSHTASDSVTSRIAPPVAASNPTLPSSASRFHPADSSAATAPAASEKQCRHAADVALGTQIIRARSVGWQVLPARAVPGEAERAAVVRRQGVGAGEGAGGTPARGEYEGGAGLCSKFSVD
ncbi:hypothetical protein JCM21900_002826 [Sporobolomyces salmonicolor]